MLGLFKKKKEVKVLAPMNGKIINIEEVPDQVFAKKMVGDGVAVVPENGLVVSPVDGKVVQIFPTNHAVGIESKEGIELLIHVGIDTVELKGEGFTKLVEVGSEVKTGDVLLEVDLAYIKSQGKEIVTPIIVTNGNVVKEYVKGKGDAMAGKSVAFSIVLNK